MGKKKRPGVKAAASLRSQDSTHSSGFSLDRGLSTRSGMSTKSGKSRKSVKSSGGGAGWDSDEDGATVGTASGSQSRPGMPKSGASMRSMLKTANSVGSGLGMGSGHSGHRLTHKQKKARPGLAVMPQAMSTRTGSTHTTSKSRKQMSMRSLDSGKSKSSAKSRRGSSLGKSGHSTRSGGTSPAASRHVPQPPDYDDDDDEDIGEFSEEEYEEDMEQDEDYDEFASAEDENMAMAMPQTEEEIRQGLHTEQVTKGFFRKKVRSIKWYSADIDKVDAGNYEPGETIQEEDEEEGSSEYETDSDDDDDSQNPVTPDPWHIALGRGLLLLEKKGEETTPIKRWLRFLTWLTFICDATAAIVSLVQFSGVQSCCGKPILNLNGINVDWPTVIQYATIFYLILILLEVYPVLRRGFPFNIVNPLIGFMITFALFFDDSYVEALIMWCIETCAVLSEFAVYRVKIRQVNLRAIEIKQLMPKTTKKKETFEDEDEYLKDLHKARRRYYVLKQEQRMDQRLLQYLHLAVYMNIVMSSVVLMLILVIARNGGLCIEDFDYPNPFASDQLARCTYCSNPNELCQHCDDLTETYQCYFPYN